MDNVIDGEILQTSSPVPEKSIVGPQMLTFGQAIENILDGKKVTRIEWDDADTYGFLVNGVLSLHKKNDLKTYNWIVNDGDMQATDWVVVSEGN